MLVDGNDRVHPFRHDPDVETSQHLCQLPSQYVPVLVVLELLPQRARTGQLYTKHPLDFRCSRLTVAEGAPHDCDALFEPVEGVGPLQVVDRDRLPPDRRQRPERDLRSLPVGDVDQERPARSRVGVRPAQEASCIHDGRVQAELLPDMHVA